MRVLIGCEESGVVRRAFRNRGHDAWSCDLLPARDGSPYHLRMDAMKAIVWSEWDIIILHPPCTALCLSGNRYYGKDMPKNDLRLEAISWTVKLWNEACNRAKIGVCLENPQSVIWPHLGVTPQYVNPHWFGHMEQKKTGLALHNLPPLLKTNDVYAEMMQLPRHQREKSHFMSPSPTRARDRSETKSGLAAAMAEQWGWLSRKLFIEGEGL